MDSQTDIYKDRQRNIYMYRQRDINKDNLIKINQNR